MNNWIERLLQRARNSFRQSQQYVSPVSLAPPIPPRPFMYSSTAAAASTNYCNVINLMELPTSEYVYNPTTTCQHHSCSYISPSPPPSIGAAPASYHHPPPRTTSSTFVQNKQYMVSSNCTNEVKTSPAYPLLRLQQTYCLDDHPRYNESDIDCEPVRVHFNNRRCVATLSKTSSICSKSNQMSFVYPNVDDPLTNWCGQSQVIAFICGLIVIILMIMGLVSTDWLMAAGWRQGLFMHCIEEGAPTPLPFNMQEPPGCYQSRDAAYVKAAAALCVITLLTDVVATVLTGLGIRTKDHRTKYKYYRFAVLVMLLALISILIALVIYPVCFAAELNLGNRTIWEFGWAYGVGWGAAIFLFGGVILLLCDKESEEIYYKERKIVHDNDSRA